MPSRIVPSMLALRVLRRQVVSPWVECPSTALRQRYPCPSLLPSRTSHRRFSHLGPAISVNATVRVPTAFKALHGALKQLERSAVNYANLTQLRLALRGLEAEDATIRVAVLGLKSQELVIRLMKALLADPLEPEQAWERALQATKNGTALLLRFGETYSIDERNPILRTMTLPSSFLQRHNLEILVHQSNADARPSSADAKFELLPETLLNLDLGNSAQASVSSSRLIYPVHKTVFVGNGLRGTKRVLTILDRSSASHGKVIRGAINALWQELAAEEQLPNLTLINISQAQAAVDAFRQSLDNAFKYEHGWLDSNVAAVLSVIREGTLINDGPLKGVLRDYIELLLEETSSSIEQEGTEQLASLVSSTLSPTIRDELLRALADWAELAHTELRDELTNALHSRTWRKIAWWKLLWRVDDVGLVMSDILQRAYLLSAEKHLLWIGGYFRAYGLSLSGSPQHLDASDNKTPVAGTERKFGTIPTQEEVLNMVGKDLEEAQKAQLSPPPSTATATLNGEDISVAIPILGPRGPWPDEISRSRNSLLALIPPLQFRAQGIVLRTLSTTGLASAVGTLAYIGVSDTSAYSAGAIVAFGTAWALGAAQKEWNRIKGTWVQQVRTEGKRVLEQCERRGRGLVHEAAKANARMNEAHVEGAEERRQASAAVARAREALAELQQHRP